MSVSIYSKKNTDVLQQVVNGEVFICCQGETEACAIIQKMDFITKIEKDQVLDYSQRKKYTLEKTEKWLGPNLNYQ